VKLSRRPIATRAHAWALLRLGYGNGDPATNGEYRLLDELPAEPIVFDVGAHHGDYAAAVLDRRPNATVHCFEPAAETFEILSGRVGDRAHLHRVALADQAGARTLYGDRTGSPMASLFRRELGWLNLGTDALEEVETRTLDDVCISERVDRIDMLKIDAEGAEYLVLLGAQRMLGERRVGRIMFEYGGTALDSHFFMREFFQLLDGYTLYRVLPDGLLPLGAYREQLEVAQYSNYVAMPEQTL
jgi:FkbM family methyltransferase